MRIKKQIFVVLFLCFRFCLFSQVTDENIPVKVLHDLSLRHYIPHTENSKVVSLTGSSSLYLPEDLPKLDGATALYPVYASFVQAVYPPADYSELYKGIVQCTQTSGAYNNLINGTANIIFCAEPSADQMERAAQQGIEFNMTPLGTEAFVLFVNKDNPINNITSEQIRGIYSGEITNWKEIGGEDQPILPYQRPKDSGSQTILENIIMKVVPIMEPAKEDVAVMMGGIIEQVSVYTNYPNAIGYSFLFFSTEMVNNNEIKLLSIDGVMPSKETIQSGEYIFTGLFYAITSGNESENTKKFIDWMVSDEGQYLIEQTGYIPLK